MLSPIQMKNAYLASVLINPKGDIPEYPAHPNA